MSVCSIEEVAAASPNPIWFQLYVLKDRGFMRDALERAQAAGRTPADLSARSCAGTMLMMLERLSAVGPMSRDDDDVGYADLKAAAAHSIAMMLGARE